jgi:hypothetical protein
VSQVSSSELSKTKDDLSFALECVTRKVQLNEDGLQLNKAFRLLSTQMMIYLIYPLQKCMFYLAVIRLLMLKKN